MFERSINFNPKQQNKADEATEKNGARSEAESRLRRLSESGIVAVAYFSVNGGITEANDAFLELLGVTKEDLLSGKVRWDDYTLKEWLPRTYKAIEELKATGIITPYEKQFRRTDGAIRWGIFGGALLPDNKTGISLVIDITERKHAEATLRESESKLSTELATTRQLEQISRSVIEEQDASNLYRQILEAARSLMHSDTASIQMFVPERNELFLLSHIGFVPESVKHWEWVNVEEKSSCGLALQLGERVVIPDLEVWGIAEPEELAAYRLSNIRATQSTRLVSRNGNIVGMMSTHWYNVYQPTESELLAFDVLARLAADVIERRNAEEVLRKSEEKYRNLFSSMTEGFIICEMVYDEQGKASDWKWLEVNPAFEEQCGLKSEKMVDHLRSEVFPEMDNALLQKYAYVVESQQPMQFEQFSAEIDRWLFVHAVPFGGKQFAVLFGDITDRKKTEIAVRESEERKEFLLKLSDALRPLTNAAEVESTACKLLGEHLGVNRVLYCTVEGEGERAIGIIRGQFVHDVVPVPDQIPYMALCGGFVAELFRTGIPLVVNDVTTDDRFEEEVRAAWLAIDAYSAVAVSLVKHGRGELIFGFHHKKPKIWSAAEIALVNEVAERTWDAAERVTAENALRQSENLLQNETARLKATLQSINDAVYIGDASGITLANQPALDQLGYSSYDDLNKDIGTLSEEIQTRDAETNEIILPEQLVFARALTGEHAIQNVRVHHHKSEKERILRSAASPVIVDGKIVASVAVNTDITEQWELQKALRQNEERQAFLLKLSDALRPLSDPVAIQETAMQVLGKHLKVNRAFYGDMQDDDDTLLIGPGYACDVFPLEGQVSFSAFDTDMLNYYRTGKTVVIDDVNEEVQFSFSAQTRAAFDTIRVGAAMGVPLVKGGKVRAILSLHQTAPRRWKPEEVSLLEETAERTWAAVERARAEETLRKVEEQYRQKLEREVNERTVELLENHRLLESIYNTTHVGMSVFKPVHNRKNKITDFEIVIVNKRIETSTGRTDLPGKLYTNEFPGIKKTGLFDIMVKAMETGERIGLEYFYEYDGFNRWYSTVCARAGDTLVCSNMDLTEQKLVEEKNRELDRRQKELEELQQQQIFRTILDTQEVERKRIAETLHNSLGQILYGTKLGLDQLHKAELRDGEKENLKNVDRLLNAAITESRRLSHELMPVILEDFGLKIAVEDICRQLSGQVRFNCRFRGPAKRLDKYIEVAIYRIIQELMMNIVKHSVATEALVAIEIQKDQILILVQDNGKGFDARSQKATGIGLKTIQNKISLLKGNINMESAGGKGTVININIPIQSVN